MEGLSLIHLLFLVLVIVISLSVNNAQDVALSNRLFESKAVSGSVSSSSAPPLQDPTDVGLVSLPFPGHLSPLLALADHLAAAGYKVSIYSTDEALRSLPSDFIRNQAYRECQREEYHMRPETTGKYLCGCLTTGKGTYPASESERALFKEFKVRRIRRRCQLPPPRLPHTPHRRRPTRKTSTTKT